MLQFFNGFFKHEFMSGHCRGRENFLRRVTDYERDESSWIVISEDGEEASRLRCLIFLYCHRLFLYCHRQESHNCFFFFFNHKQFHDLSRGVSCPRQRSA